MEQVCNDLDSQNYLLRNEDKMIIKDDKNIPNTCTGYYPDKRPIELLLKYGVVILDKPPNPSSHEVVSWVKQILKCTKTGQCTTLDPKVTGVLPIYLNDSTKAIKFTSGDRKVYLCEILLSPHSSSVVNNNQFLNGSEKIKKKVISRSDFENACKKLTGQLFQRPPLMCAVKRDIRLRWIYKIMVDEFIECSSNSNKEDSYIYKALFRIECEAGTYIRSLCTHLGHLLGVKGEMAGLRRLRSGILTENECVTLFDLKEAFHHYSMTCDDGPLRKVIKPVEYILRGFKRIIIKDTAIEALCYGGQLCVSGVIKYERGIENGDKIVIVSQKGEAVALAKFVGDFSKQITRGIVAKTERVIMEKGIYPKCWGLLSSDGGKEYEVVK